MATVVTLTIADADAPRVANAAISPGQWAASPIPPGFPPTGATNAALIKAWLSAVVSTATLAHEGNPSGVAPAIT